MQTKRVFTISYFVFETVGVYQFVRKIQLYRLPFHPGKVSLKRFVYQDIEL